MAFRHYDRGAFFRKQQLMKTSNAAKGCDFNDNFLDNNLEENSVEIACTEDEFSPTMALEFESNRESTQTDNLVDNVNKRKSSESGASNPKVKANKRAKKSGTPQLWKPERVELLLQYMKEYKSKSEFNGVEFEADLPAMYTEIRRCLASVFPNEFGPEVPIEPSKSIREMDGDEYKRFKKQRDDEQERIKKGYDRVKEKIRTVRQSFRQAINKGTRSGSGRVVQENFELLKEIWGGSPATTLLPFGVNTDTLGVNNNSHSEDDSFASLEETLPSQSPNSSLSDETNSQHTSSSTSSSATSQKKNVAISNIPKFVDNKHRDMQKALSQGQRDQLLLNSAKEDMFMKQQLMKSFEKSNKTLEDSIGKMTNCLNSIGEGMAKGMQLLATALTANQAPPPTMYPPHFYGNFPPQQSMDASQFRYQVPSPQMRPADPAAVEPRGPIMAAAHTLYDTDVQDTAGTSSDQYF